MRRFIKKDSLRKRKKKSIDATDWDKLAIDLELFPLKDDTKFENVELARFTKMLRMELQKKKQSLQVALTNTAEHFDIDLKDPKTAKKLLLALCVGKEEIDKRK